MNIHASVSEYWGCVCFCTFFCKNISDNLFPFGWICNHRWWHRILSLMLLQLITCIWPMFIHSFSLLQLLFQCLRMRFCARVVEPFVKCFSWSRCVVIHSCWCFFVSVWRKLLYSSLTKKTGLDFQFQQLT